MPKYRTHLLIPDAQIKEGVPTDHLTAARNFICEERPHVIVNIGDFWDMPALSGYHTRLSEQGQEIGKDFRSGNHAMAQLTRNWPKGYRPERHFTIGNHEERIARALAAEPKLRGLIGYDKLQLTGWRVHPYLKPITIDGVTYAHYFYNPMSGKPLGGTVQNMLNKIGFSFVQGHRQEMGHSRKELANGKVIHGLVAGAFHLHDEEYKGHQAANHWRGLVRLHDVRDGDYDIEVISMARLMREYGE